MSVDALSDQAEGDSMRFAPGLYDVLDDPREENHFPAERPGLATALRAPIAGSCPVPQ
jgi:hypothetical protein